MGCGLHRAPVSATSVFCEHKKLRTTCPDCRAAAAPSEPTAGLTPYRPAGEPKATRSTSSSTKVASSDSGEAKEPRKKSGALLPQRRRQKTPKSRAEAEQAEAWWVKR